MNILAGKGHTQTFTGRLERLGIHQKFRTGDKVVPAEIEKDPAISEWHAPPGAIQPRQQARTDPNRILFRL